MKIKLRQYSIWLMASVTLDKSMTLEFAQVVAKLIETVTFIGEMEGGQDGLMDLLGCPSADVSAAMQENLA